MRPNYSLQGEEGNWRGGGAHLFSLVPYNRMHGNAASGRFGLDSRKDTSEKVVRHCDRLPREMTGASHFSLLMKNLSMSHNYVTCKRKKKKLKLI